MAFPQTGAGGEKQDAVKKGVFAGQGLGGAVGQAVGGPHHKFVKGEFPVQRPARGAALAVIGQVQLFDGGYGHHGPGLRRGGQQLNRHGVARLGQHLIDMGQIMGHDPAEGKGIGADKLQLPLGSLVRLEWFDPQ